MIKDIIKFIYDQNLDAYILPKNDNFFTEYSKINNLAEVTNFKGSAGFALILKNKNYLFVDGRYTLQANKQSGKNFKVCQIPYFWPKNIKNIQNYKIGFDPELFTKRILNLYFEDNANLMPVKYNFNNKTSDKVNKIYRLNNSVTGEDEISKIIKVKKYMKKNKINYLYSSASENVNWLLNIRGKDLPNSPLINCKIIIPERGKLYLFVNSNKITKSIKKYFKNIILCGENSLFKTIFDLKKGTFCIDKNTCSIYEQQIINSKFKIIHDNDPIYDLKSIKNKVEIKNTLKAHIEDGVAITKFLYWFKHNKKKISEKKVETKLQKFRNKSKNYLYPSFDTIAGSGPNGAIIHYKSSNLTNRVIKKNDILLIDSGGQYKWGTTDITRTICSGKVSNTIKDNFTRVLKGHISVITCDLNENFNGHLIDKLARKSLKKVGLNYSHGTGHGVGFFLNVHEGPQAISIDNKVKLKAGMILSNEPGFYLYKKYGIRIENLIYVHKEKLKMKFKNLTFAPIDIDLINFKMLNNKEKKYLFDYHLSVYAKISKFLNNAEKKWLINLIY